MTPALKTVGILALSGAVACGALLLTQAPRSAATLAPPTARPTPSQKAAFLSAIPESTHFLRGVGETHIAVSVLAPHVDRAATRLPLSVAIVLDRSGSMEGEKLAAAKRAAEALILKLDRQDNFSVTVYGTEVETIAELRVAEPAAVETALAAVRQITERGGTNLSGGLIGGRDELVKSDGSIRRIVLISDGRANNGIVFEDQLADLARETAEMGISVTTLGVGLDFDEKKMTAIAVAGRGNYYYAEHAADLSALFAAELDRVTATAATNVTVTLEPAAGVEVLEAYGHQLLDNTATLADLHAGETRRIVFRVRSRQSENGVAALGTVRLALTAAASGERISESAPLEVTVTDDHHAVLRGQDKDAIAMVERARTAITLEKATSLYESGDASGARQIVNQRRAEAAKRAADVGSASLGAEIDGIAADAEASFAPAPSSDEGKKSRKGNRAKSYELLY